MESPATLWRQLPHLLATTRIGAHDLEQLGERMALLDDSCEQYDARVLGDVQPLAVALRDLLHDSETSTSVLGRLGLKSAVPWADGTLQGDPLWVRDEASTGPIPVVSMLTVVRPATPPTADPGEVRLAPAFTSAELGDHWLTFPSWWEQPRIYSFPDVAISRRDLVLHLANERDARAERNPRDERDARTDHDRRDHPDLRIHHERLLSAAIRQVAEEVRFTLRATLFERGDAAGDATGDAALALRHPLGAGLSRS